MKQIAIVVLLCCMTLLGGCAKPDSPLMDGKYVAQNVMGTYIEFDLKNKTFKLVHIDSSSHFPSGQFECTDGKVYATDEFDLYNTSTYVFEIIDKKTIRFIENESAEVMFYVPPDGELEFVLSE